MTFWDVLFPENINNRHLLLLVEVFPIDNMKREVESAFYPFMIDKIPDNIGAPVVRYPVKSVPGFKLMAASRT